MPESSNKGGRIPRVSDTDLLDVFRSTTDPVLSTAEVADQVPIKRRGTLNRLQALEEDGELESKQIGGRNTVWWLARETVEESRETAPRADTARDATDGPTDPPADAHGAESDPIDRDKWRDDLAETLAGSGGLAERRADAILKMYDHLREHGAAENDELRALADPDALGYKDAKSVWSNMVKGKDTLRALPGVQKPSRGRNDPWGYDAEVEP